MPFPIIDCGEGPPLSEDCCSSLFDKGVEILAYLAPYMAECAVASPCCGEPLRYFVSLNRPETWQQDFLSIHLENLRPTQGSERGGRTLIPPSLLVAWRLTLVESCYPGLIELGPGAEGKIQYATPTDDEFHVANLYAYAHAQALLRGIFAYAAENDCTSFKFRDLQPLRPENYTGGWTLGFDLEF